MQNNTSSVTQPPVQTPVVNADPISMANTQPEAAETTPEVPQNKPRTGRIILIILAVFLVFALVLTGLFWKALSPFMQAQSGYFPSNLPLGYSPTNIVVDTFKGGGGGQGVGVMYFSNDAMLSLSQEEAPLTCGKISTSSGTLVSDYSAFNPTGYDPGCTFFLGKPSIGSRVYTWGKTGIRFYLISHNPYITRGDATNIAESLKYGKLKSNIFTVIKILRTSQIRDF